MAFSKPETCYFFLTSRLYRVLNKLMIRNHRPYTL